MAEVTRNPIETQLCDLLSGRPTPVSLVQDPVGSFKPLVKRNVTYIVAGLVFREDGKFVLIQEAKKSCYGKWYLPAGRVEPGENLVDAVRREVKEEAGLDFEPSSLICVEASCCYWYRFVYIGKAVGGSLKTLAEKDEESLQAEWFTMKDLNSSSVPLRCVDVVSTMKIAMEYLKRNPEDRQEPLSVTINPHSQLVHRLVIVCETKERELELLTFKGSLPSCIIEALTAGPNVILNVIKDAFQAPVRHTVKGVLSVEHCGVPSREHDGICISTLVVLDPSQCDITGKIARPEYTWTTLTETGVKQEIVTRLQEHKNCVLR